jgi:hypothetical protein
LRKEASFFFRKSSGYNCGLVFWNLPWEGAWMAKSSRPTAQKRAREKARAERQKEKEARRAEAKERRASAPVHSGDEDPDIAGIRPGPQPRPEWMEDLPEDEVEDTEEEGAEGRP